MAKQKQLEERRFLQRYLPNIATDFSHYFETAVGDELQRVVEEVTLDAIGYACSYFANHHDDLQRTVKSAHQIQVEQKEQEEEERDVLNTLGTSECAKKVFENEYLNDNMSNVLEYAFEQAGSDFRSLKALRMKLENRDTYPYY